MGIQLNWENDERTVLCHVYDGVWTVNDFYIAMDESRHLLLSVEHPVDLIIDMRTAAGPPPAVLPAYKYADKQVPPNQRLIVMIKTGGMMKAFNRMVGRIAPKVTKNRYVVDDLEKARHLLTQYQAQVN
jgi:hypothetical protein